MTDREAADARLAAALEAEHGASGSGDENAHGSPPQPQPKKRRTKGVLDDATDSRRNAAAPGEERRSRCAQTGCPPGMQHLSCELVWHAACHRVPMMRPYCFCLLVQLICITAPLHPCCALAAGASPNGAWMGISSTIRGGAPSARRPATATAHPAPACPAGPPPWRPLLPPSRHRKARCAGRVWAWALLLLTGARKSGRRGCLRLPFRRPHLPPLPCHRRCARRRAACAPRACRAT